MQFRWIMRDTPALFLFVGQDLRSFCLREMGAFGMMRNIVSGFEGTWRSEYKGKVWLGKMMMKRVLLRQVMGLRLRSYMG